MLPGSVPNIHPNTNPLPPSDATYVHRHVHMGTVAGFKLPFWLDFHTNGQSNKVVYRMISDHFLFLRSNNLTSSKTYLYEYMEDRLRDGSFANNRSFNDEVFAGVANNKARHWNMPNTKAMRD